MTTAAEKLAGYGITVDQARAWIMGNLESPALVFNTAKQYGITSSMLAEIVAPAVPGATASLVEGFFTSKGLDGTSLAEHSSSSGSELLPADVAALSSLVTFNTNTGVLSTASLRAAVITGTVTTAEYNAAFNPAHYAGSGDGTITGAELGVSNFPSFAATQENFESIYYGTTIKAFKAIDMSEIMQISDFVQKNGAAIDAGNQAALDAYIDLMVSVFEDPAAQPLFTDQQLAESIVTSTKVFVELVAGGDSAALFDALFMGYM